MCQARSLPIDQPNTWSQGSGGTHIDSIVWQGKNPSFLQVYHHTGIVLLMWAGVASQAPWLVLVVGLNSVIHTLMYCYFGVKTLYPHMQIKCAKYLTMAQISQFCGGIVLNICATIHMIGRDCISRSSSFGLACFHLYLYGLIALFAAFAVKKYRTKSSGKGKLL